MWYLRRLISLIRSDSCLGLKANRERMAIQMALPGPNRGKIFIEATIPASVKRKSLDSIFQRMMMSWHFDKKAFIHPWLQSYQKHPRDQNRPHHEEAKNTRANS